jgi:tetratricopeptide (TPR) repeat protein
MSGDTTSISEGMTCDRVAAEEIPELYLRNRLSEEDREAFERHFFECPRCFDELRTLDALTRELRESAAAEVAPEKPRRRWLIAAAGVAALLVMAATAMLWRQATTVPVPSKVATGPSPSDAAPQTPGRREDTAPAAPPVSLEQLARIEPAPYEPTTFRNVPDAAITRFQQGMERYRQGDYRSAITSLQEAAMLEPDAPHIRFFLGVSQLIAGDTTSAVDSLRAAIATGDTPYLEEAHLYLAKAFLRQQNLAAAQGQLNEVVALQGPRRDEANRLLGQITTLRSP